jgi:hypothetical protein
MKILFVVILFAFSGCKKRMSAAEAQQSKQEKSNTVKIVCIPNDGSSSILIKQIEADQRFDNCSSEQLNQINAQANALIQRRCHAQILPDKTETYAPRATCPSLVVSTNGGVDFKPLTELPEEDVDTVTVKQLKSKILTEIRKINPDIVESERLDSVATNNALNASVQRTDGYADILRKNLKVMDPKAVVVVIYDHMGLSETSRIFSGDLIKSELMVFKEQIGRSKQTGIGIKLGTVRHQSSVYAIVRFSN